MRAEHIVGCGGGGGNTSGRMWRRCWWSIVPAISGTRLLPHMRTLAEPTVILRRSPSFSS